MISMSSFNSNRGMVSVATTATLILTSMMVELMKENKTNHVDNKTNDRNSNQPIVVDFDRWENSLYTLAEDIVRYEHQENTIEKPWNGLHLAIPVSVLVVSLRQLSYVGRYKPNEQSCAVEKHVESIWHQTQWIGPVSIKKLNEHERHINRKEYQYFPRLFILPSDFDDVNYDPILGDLQIEVFRDPREVKSHRVEIYPSIFFE